MATNSKEEEDWVSVGERCEAMDAVQPGVASPALSSDAEIEEEEVSLPETDSADCADQGAADGPSRSMVLEEPFPAQPSPDAHAMEGYRDDADDDDGSSSDEYDDEDTEDAGTETSTPGCANTKPTYSTGVKVLRARVDIKDDAPGCLEVSQLARGLADLPDSWSKLSAEHVLFSESWSRLGVKHALFKSMGVQREMYARLFSSGDEPEPRPRWAEQIPHDLSVVVQIIRDVSQVGPNADCARGALSDGESARRAVVWVLQDPSASDAAWLEVKSRMDERPQEMVAHTLFVDARQTMPDETAALVAQAVDRSLVALANWGGDHSGASSVEVDPAVRGVSNETVVVGALAIIAMAATSCSTAAGMVATAGVGALLGGWDVVRGLGQERWLRMFTMVSVLLNVVFAVWLASSPGTTALAPTHGNAPKVEWSVGSKWQPQLLSPVDAFPPGFEGFLSQWERAHAICERKISTTEVEAQALRGFLTEALHKCGWWCDDTKENMGRRHGWWFQEDLDHPTILFVKNHPDLSHPSNQV